MSANPPQPQTFGSLVSKNRLIEICTDRGITFSVSDTIATLVERINAHRPASLVISGSPAHAYFTDATARDFFRGANADQAPCAACGQSHDPAMACAPAPAQPAQPAQPVQLPPGAQAAFAVWLQGLQQSAAAQAPPAANAHQAPANPIPPEASAYGVLGAINAQTWATIRAGGYVSLPTLLPSFAFNRETQRHRRLVLAASPNASSEVAFVDASNDGAVVNSFAVWVECFLTFLAAHTIVDPSRGPPLASYGAVIARYSQDVRWQALLRADTHFRNVAAINFPLDFDQWRAPQNTPHFDTAMFALHRAAPSTPPLASSSSNLQGVKRVIEESYQNRSKKVSIGGRSTTVCIKWNANKCDSDVCIRHHICFDCHAPGERRGHSGCPRSPPSA